MNLTISVVGGRSPSPKGRRVFTTAFARRNSWFSRSSLASRTASSVVVPGRRPPSISSWVTQLRNVLGLVLLVVDPGHRSHPSDWITRHVHRQPDRPVPQVFGVLLGAELDPAFPTAD